MAGAVFVGGGGGPEIGTRHVRPLLASSSGPLTEAHYGRPTPTDSWNPGVLYPALTEGIDALDLRGIPVNDLPSGGGWQPGGMPTDGRISPSELFLVWTQFGPDDNGEGDTPQRPVSFLRHRWTMQGRVLFEWAAPFIQPYWTYAMAYTFVGRFDRTHPGPQGYVNDHDEILGPGTVYCDVSSGLGSAQFVFQVTDSTPLVLAGRVGQVIWS